MPEPTPKDPGQAVPEREMLLGFLDFYRSVMIRKIDGVSPEGLRRSPVDSGTCLGGLLKHLAYVERWWFQAFFASREVDFPWTEEDPDADFRLDEDDTSESLIDLYRRECDLSRKVVGDVDLDATVPGRRGDVTLRWILVHMIEETARHAGHADLLREMIDGSVGD